MKIIKNLSFSLFSLFVSFLTLSISSNSVSALSVIRSASTCTSINQNIYNGISGNEVKKLQKFLFEKGYLAAMPKANKFGPSTVAAVKKFQAENNLIVTGNVGQVSRNKIKEMSCAKAVSSTNTENKTTQNKINIIQNTQSSSTVISWDLNLNEPFILNWKDFKTKKETDNGIFRILINKPNNTNIKLVELIPTKNCMEYRRYTMYDSSKNDTSSKQKTAVQITDLGIDVSAIYVVYLGDHATYFVRATFDDGTSQISKYPVFSLIDPWRNDDITLDQYKEVLKECSFNDTDSKVRMDKAFEIFDYNNEITPKRNIFMNSATSSCREFYQKNISTFADCTINDAVTNQNSLNDYCFGKSEAFDELKDKNIKIYNECYVKTKK